MGIIKAPRPIVLDRELFELGLDLITFRVYAQLCYLSESISIESTEAIDDEGLIEACCISQAQYKKAMTKLVKLGLLGKEGDAYTLVPASEWGRIAASKNTKIPGFVYLAQSGQQYKIGKSKHPEQRILQLSTASPQAVTLICAIAVDDMTSAEAELHRQFANKRIRGEWFALSLEDVNLIKSLDGASNA